MTGKEVSEVKGWQTSLQCIYLYCCVKSACEREKREFPYECTEFCDNVPLGDLQAWIESESERLTEDEAEKKFDKFEAVLKAHRERDDMMQPHCIRRLNPRKVLPFEWEKTRRGRHVNPAPELSKA